MTTDAAALADRLLDAHVAHLVEELTGPDGTGAVAADVRILLEALADVTVHELIDHDAARGTVELLLDTVGRSAAVASLVETLPVLLYDLPADDVHHLGEVVDRRHVEALVDELARSANLRAEIRRRTEQSPTLAVVATRFVSALVSDTVQQNRRRAERLPGVKSMLGVGDFAARQARGMAPKQLEQLVGDAADLGTKVALERVIRALDDALDDEMIANAAMEIWDLHAAEPVAGLRAYLATSEVEGLAETGREAWRSAAASPWLRAAVDAAVARFLHRYEQYTVTEMLAALGLDVDRVVAEVQRHLPGALDALEQSGQLESLVRRRLEPFYRSQTALEILAE
jgi:hypothetical protein